MSKIVNATMDFSPFGDGELQFMPPTEVVMAQDQSYQAFESGVGYTRRKIRIWYVDSMPIEERHYVRQCMLVESNVEYPSWFEHVISIVMNDGSLYHLVRDTIG